MQYVRTIHPRTHARKTHQPSNQSTHPSLRLPAARPPRTQLNSTLPAMTSTSTYHIQRARACLRALRVRPRLSDFQISCPLQQQQQHGDGGGAAGTGVVIGALHTTSASASTRFFFSEISRSNMYVSLLLSPFSLLFSPFYFLSYSRADQQPSYLTCRLPNRNSSSTQRGELPLLSTSKIRLLTLESQRFDPHRRGAIPTAIRIPSSSPSPEAPRTGLTELTETVPRTWVRPFLSHSIRFSIFRVSLSLSLF